MNRRSFLNAISLAPAATLVPSIVLGRAEANANAALSTWPHIIYKKNDGILADLEPAETKSFVFNLLVKSENRNIEAQGAHLEFYSSGDRANVVELSKKTLSAVRRTSISAAGDLDREGAIRLAPLFFNAGVSQRRQTSLQLDSRRTWSIGSGENVGDSTFEIPAKN